jgi:hypothetical protein
MKIIVRRDSGWSDSIRAYKLHLDGVQVAKISDGQTIELEACPGEHTLQASIDWHKTSLLKFSLGTEMLTFDVFSKVRGARLLLSIVWALVPGQWIGIKQSRS